MQSLSQETGRSGNRGGGEPDAAPTDAPQPSLFSLAESYAERASRAGFVVSVMFLVATGFYALNLSGATGAIFNEIADVADGAAHDAGFRVEDLAVSGSKNTPQATLLKALGLPFPKSSLSYDAVEAHDRLSKLGWIASAEVRRVLPSRLEVVVSERTPFARWADADDTVQVIDREGRVLGPAEDGFSTLMLFGGDGAQSEAAEFIEAVSERDAIRRRIERADLIAGRFWQIKLDTGVLIKLPRKVNELVLGRLESLLANTKIADMALDTIDLRLTNRTILQLKEPTLANRDRAIAALTGAPAQYAAPPRRAKAL